MTGDPGNGAVLQPLVKVIPIRIVALNAFEFPGAVPAFLLFLARDGVFGTVVGFDINKRFDAVALRKTIGEAFFMFVDTSRQIIGHADIQSAVPPA